MPAGIRTSGASRILLVDKRFGLRSRRVAKCGQLGCGGFIPLACLDRGRYAGAVVKTIAGVGNWVRDAHSYCDEICANIVADVAKVSATQAIS
jgi:hypothetical protein